MQVTQPTIAQAIELYIGARQRQYAVNTIRRNKSELRHLVDVLGRDSKIAKVTAGDMDRVLGHLAGKMSAAAYNNAMSTYGSFFRYCSTRGYTAPHHDPIGERRYMKVQKKDRRRVPVTKFQLLLDSTDYPRDRLIIALGIYLFLRQSEMATLKVKDVNLTNGEINVTVHKTGDFDIMPICAELDVELRRYLVWYTEQQGPLDPEWYLVPSRTNISVRRENGQFGEHRGQGVRLRPERQMTKIEDVAKRALESIGHPVYDENGKGLFEGVHTLRRSGARALFDEMRNQGYDGALQRVRAMLHHASATMTERYLGISVERTQRNEALIGKSMFNIGGSNIVPLGGRNGTSQTASM